MGQALYRKWRPQTFDDLIGQEHVVQTLRYALRTGHIHHAYLLAGPRGTGKTTTARLIAKSVNCQAPAEERPCNQCESCQAINEGRFLDLIEMDAASNTGVDDIRSLLEKVGFRPAQARYKVYVIDEVHMLSTSAFNALLKTLEEPPEHVIFVLATTEVHRIPETILSRCQRFEFRRIPLREIVDRLQLIAQAEGIQAEPEALDLIGRTATGSMRDAISLLDQLAASGTITADYVRLMLGAERREVVRTLLQAWVEKDLKQGLDIINRAIDGGADPRQLARQTADYLRGLLLMRIGAGQTWTEPTTEERAVLEDLARRAEPRALIDAIQRFSEAASKQRAGWQPQLPLELAFVRSVLGEENPASTQPRTPAVTPSSRSGRKAAPARRPKRERVTATRTGQPPSQDNGGKRAEETSVSQATAPATTDRTSDAPAVAALQAAWPEVIRSVRPVSLGALLRDATPGGLDDEGRLVLVFQHEFHRGRVMQSDNLRAVERRLAEILNQPAIVRCVLAEEWEPQPPDRPASPPSSGGLTPEDDELIRRAQEELGAVPRVTS